MKSITTILILLITLSIGRNTSSGNTHDQKGIEMEYSENFNDGISGKYFIYSTIAYKDFKEKQKNIEDFTIYVKDQKNEIELTFHPNLAEGERPKLGGGTSLGRTIVYLISKKDKKIIKINFQR